MAAGPGSCSRRRPYNDGEVGPRLTHVCHYVLLWVFVFDIGHRVEKRNKDETKTPYLDRSTTPSKLKK